MQPACLSRAPQPCIHQVAKVLDSYVATHWRQTLDTHARSLAQIHAAEAEAAYGAYLRVLLRPAAPVLRRMGFEWYPRLPGTAFAARWGPVEQDAPWRQYEHLAVAALCRPSGAPVGTLVTATLRERSGFGLRCRPQIFGLPVVGIERVRQALLAPPTGQGTSNKT